jgi:hypothetical protein
MLSPLPYGFGPWSEPACIAVYGPPGSGKSTDLAATLPDAWNFAPPGGTRSVQTFVGPELYAEMRQRVVQVRHLAEVTQYLALMAQGKIERRPVIVDDASILAGALHDILRPQFPMKNNFQFWAAIRKHIRDLRDAGRWAGVHVFLNAHPIEGAPQWVLEESTGAMKFVKGGPLFAGKAQTAEVTHSFDVILEVRRDQTRADKGLWPSTYWSEPNCETHHVKDRHGIVETNTPMNLREILKAASFVMPRPPGLEWMDALAPVVAGRIDKGEERGEIFHDIRGRLLGKGINRHHVGWALRDAFDAYDIAHRETWADRAYRAKPAPTTTAPTMDLAGALSALAAPESKPPAGEVTPDNQTGVLPGIK